jgi:tRNA1(Val) A37 N6-methylase TrmN6
MQVQTPLADWVSAAARRLRPGGWLTLVCLADGLPEVLSATGGRLGSVDLLPLSPRSGKPALRVLVRARKGGRAPFRLLAPLVIHRGASHDGDRESYTPEANAVLRDGADLLALFS